MNPQTALHYSIGVVALALAAAGVVWLLRRRRPTPEQLEAARRQRLQTMGRLGAGEILDMIAAPAEAGEQAAPTVVYGYEVRGVSYEATQPLYWIPVTLDPQSWIPGLPVQIKYDPANPGNSIVACEQWSGLRAPGRAPEEAGRRKAGSTSAGSIE